MKKTYIAPVVEGVMMDAADEILLTTSFTKNDTGADDGVVLVKDDWNHDTEDFWD